jgi:hypothetical protein
MRIRTSRKRQAADRLRKRKRRSGKKRRIKKPLSGLQSPASPVEVIPELQDLAAEKEQAQTETVRDSAFQAGYAKGFQEGKYAGGEEWIDQLLPPDQMLPDISVREIIAAGVNRYKEHAVPLLLVEQIQDAILRALEEQRPLSLVRLGDGELLTLAQEVVLPIETVMREGKFLQYAGVNVPDLEIRGRLAEAVQRADIVGVPRTRMPNYQLLVGPVFRAYNIPYAGKLWTDSLVNYRLCQAGYLLPILHNRRVLVIGNMAEPLSAVLAGHGIAVAGIISPVNGAQDAARVIQAARQYDFDIALVSAGIAAVLITEELARVTGKVAIDFGHLANAIVKGEFAIK